MDVSFWTLFAYAFTIIAHSVARCESIAGDNSNDISASNLTISKYIYDRLVYFSKASAMTNCIAENQLVEDLEFDKGGCPSFLNFCTDQVENPTVGKTKMELVLSAKRGELGTGYVAVDYAKEVIIVAFRSSNTRQDWYSDFEIYPTDYVPGSIYHYKNLVEKGEIPECKDCQIHRGFYRFKQTLGKYFLKKVETILNKYPEYDIVVVGHSLGAAMATIAGIEFKLRGYDPTVITYATPKMFNSNMQHWVNEIFKSKPINAKSINDGELHFDQGGYFRIVHNGDYIPMLPPFYHAAGLEIYINKVELPHEPDDLEYRGFSLNEDNSNVNKKTTGYMEELLHSYEHRAYFIQIRGCQGF